MSKFEAFRRSLLARGHRAHFNDRPMEDKKVAVCFALAEEAGAFEKVCGDKVPFFLTGIGRENAEKATRKFLEGRKPSLLMTCGFAGGLKSGLEIGDVVFEIPSNSQPGNDAYTAV